MCALMVLISCAWSVMPRPPSSAMLWQTPLNLRQGSGFACRTCVQSIVPLESGGKDCRARYLIWNGLLQRYRLVGLAWSLRDTAPHLLECVSSEATRYALYRSALVASQVIIAGVAGAPLSKRHHLASYLLRAIGRPSLHQPAALLK